ncbi:MAG: PrsW family glutamic-type intramembrane protease [Candidatus Gracilibacteria bacterium]|jgi:RsiW-degrading membrane proteinase PrsW (M82 family)
MPSAHILKILVSIALAAVPAIIWTAIFLKKRKEPLGIVLITFVAGMVSVAPIILYKLSWQYLPGLNLFTYFDRFGNNTLGFTQFLYLPVSTLLSFLLVGVIEEYAKHVAVKVADGGKFKNVDDAMEYSIIAALGFSFVENVMYFFYIWQYQGFDTLYLSFVFRAIFSTFAHILFSGVYGYYYGLAYFAKPIYQQDRHPCVNFLHKLLNLKSETVFAEEKITQGLLYAVILHAFFNVMLELNITYIIVPFLIWGYSGLSYLFIKKRSQVEFGK